MMMNRRASVEESAALGILDLERLGVFYAPSPLTITLPPTSLPVEVGIVVDQDGVPDPSTLRLRYRLPEVDGTLSEYSMTVGVDTTPIGSEGGRKWLLCPRMGCGQRCRKLYLAPKTVLFACRTCRALTYESRRLSGTRIYEGVTRPQKTLRMVEKRLPRARHPAQRQRLLKKAQEAQAKLTGSGSPNGHDL